MKIALLAHHIFVQLHLAIQTANSPSTFCVNIVRRYIRSSSCQIGLPGDSEDKSTLSTRLASKTRHFFFLTPQHRTASSSVLSRDCHIAWRPNDFSVKIKVERDYFNSYFRLLKQSRIMLLG